MQKMIHRMNQTAHISLQILAISKSVETKSTRSAAILWRILRQLPQVFLPSGPAGVRRCFRLASPLCASAPPVRGYLRIAAETCNPFFLETSSFFQKTMYSLIYMGFGVHFYLNFPLCSPVPHKIRAPDSSIYCVIHRVIPNYPPIALRFTANHPRLASDSLW